MNRLSIMAEMEEQPSFQAVLNIHDDLTFYVPKKQQDGITERIVNEMLRLVFPWMCVPLSVEVKAGPNWAELTPVGTYYSDEETNKPG